MARTSYGRRIPGQHFLKSAALVRSLIGESTIGPGDIVYDIGAGRGAITAELARSARAVVAIEPDGRLVLGLRERFREAGNVRILQCDFLQYRIPDPGYKVFANIPYHITARIVRKILYESPQPCEAYLVMQAEAARKFAGALPFGETQFSVLAKPYHTIQIQRELRRTDFEPVPAVDSVLLHIRKRAAPLISPAEAGLYREFVRFGFGAWKKNLKITYKRVFSYPQWKHLSRDLGFPLDAVPSQLSFEQWLGLFEGFKTRMARTGELRE